MKPQQLIKKCFHLTLSTIGFVGLNFTFYHHTSSNINSPQTSKLASSNQQITPLKPIKYRDVNKINLNLDIQQNLTEIINHKGETLILTWFATALYQQFLNPLVAANPNLTIIEKPSQDDWTTWFQTYHILDQPPNTDPNYATSSAIRRLLYLLLEQTLDSQPNFYQLAPKPQPSSVSWNPANGFFGQFITHFLPQTPSTNTLLSFGMFNFDACNNQPDALWLDTQINTFMQFLVLYTNFAASIITYLNQQSVNFSVLASYEVLLNWTHNALLVPAVVPIVPAENTNVALNLFTIWPTIAANLSTSSTNIQAAPYTWDQIRIDSGQCFFLTGWNHWLANLTLISPIYKKTIINWYQLTPDGKPLQFPTVNIGSLFITPDDQKWSQGAIVYNERSLTDCFIQNYFPHVFEQVKIFTDQLANILNSYENHNYGFETDLDGNSLLYNYVDFKTNLPTTPAAIAAYLSVAPLFAAEQTKVLNEYKDKLNILFAKYYLGYNAHYNGQALTYTIPNLASLITPSGAQAWWTKEMLYNFYADLTPNKGYLALFQAEQLQIQTEYQHHPKPPLPTKPIKTILITVISAGVGGLVIFFITSISWWQLRKYRAKIKLGRPW